MYGGICLYNFWFFSMSTVITHVTHAIGEGSPQPDDTMFSDVVIDLNQDGCFKSESRVINILIDYCYAMQLIQLSLTSTE